MCTDYSSWQRINDQRRSPEEIKRRMNAARVHLKFVCEIYAMQMKAGRFFVHEHPAQASSWELQCIRALLRQEGVRRVVGDQCQYGQESADGHPVKKPTGWMSNSECVLENLGQRCGNRDGTCSRPAGGKHKMCSSKVARDAARYPFEICRAILTGIHEQSEGRSDSSMAFTLYCQVTK